MGKRKFQLTAEEEQALKQAYEHSKDGATRTRYQAVRLYGTGYPVEEIQDITGCTRSSLMNWCRHYREQGLSGLEDHRCGGNHRKLSLAQRADLQERLELYTPRDVFGPQTQTVSGQFWTIEDLARAIQKWYGVLYKCRMSYLLLLNACGYSYQRSEQVYKSRREADVAEFAEQLEKK